MAVSLDDALAVFSGQVSPWFAARYHLAEKLWSQIAGSEPFEAVAAQPASLDLGQAPTRGRGQPARLLDEGFEDLLDGFPKGWANLMAPEVWIPSGGQLMRASRDQVAERLEAHSEEPPFLHLTDARLYDSRDLRSQWPAPLPACLELLCGGKRALLRAASYADDNETYGRCGMLFTVEDEKPVLQAALLPAFDEGLFGSAARSTDEHEGARILDSVVRAVCLGHAGTISLIQNHIMDRLIFNQEVIDFDRLVHHTQQRRSPHTARLVFGRTQRMSEPEDNALFRRVLNESKKVWLRKPDTFKPTAFCTDILFVDDSGALVTLERAEGVALRVWLPDGRGEPMERWRLGALTVPDIPIEAT